VVTLTGHRVQNTHR